MIGKMKEGRLTAAAADAILLALSLLAAYALRFNFAVPDYHVALLRYVAPFTLALELVLLAAFGCHRTVWRWFSAADLPRLLAALASASALSLLCRGVFSGIAMSHRFYAPISVTLMNFAMSICALVGARWLRRIVAEGGRQRATSAATVAIVGTGPASLSVAYALRHEVPATREVLGFIGEGDGSTGATIQGLPVIATLGDLAVPGVERNVRLSEVIVPQGLLDRAGMQRLLSLCRAIGARMVVAPDYSSVLDSGDGDSALRSADITDILKRGVATEATFAEHRKFLEGRRVMVTGAGGSIGSEIARQALAAGAERVTLVERGELALFEIARELGASPRAAALTRHIADVGDARRMARILAAERPEIVFHAAAYKHVPLMEENVCEAVSNNVFGTLTLARECAAAGIGTFVLLSSDKAVEPSSVMGATKRVCELAIAGIGGAGQGGGATRFTAVRFGNVLGSTGSVVPVFREQILAGGPVTITHPDMERYFMTIPEAASLTIVAAAMAPSMPGRAFVLEMGEPVKIVSLAEDMIRLAGKVPGRDVRVAFTGTRPGEKLRDRLTTSSETLAPTDNAQISCFKMAVVADKALDALLATLRAATEKGDDAAARKALLAFVGGGEDKKGKGGAA